MRDPAAIAELVEADGLRLGAVAAAGEVCAGWVAEPQLGEDRHRHRIETRVDACTEMAVSTVLAHELGGAPQSAVRVGWERERTQSGEQGSGRRVERMQRLEEGIGHRLDLHGRGDLGSEQALEAGGRAIGPGLEHVVATGREPSALVDTREEGRLEHAERGHDQLGRRVAERCGPAPHVAVEELQPKGGVAVVHVA